MFSSCSWPSEANSSIMESWLSLAFLPWRRQWSVSGRLAFTKSESFKMIEQFLLTLIFEHDKFCKFKSMALYSLMSLLFAESSIPFTFEPALKPAVTPGFLCSLSWNRAGPLTVGSIFYGSSKVKRGEFSWSCEACFYSYFSTNLKVLYAFFYFS